ncbi:MAG: ATP-dependent DNA helicase RecQ, partial [Parvicellaceae bacterium]
PTGGGKSVCFQIPALIKDGITLVISPLIALMKDQVESLKSKGIEAEALYSGMHYNTIDRILDNAIYGKVKMLYISPERLKTTLFQERLKKMNVSLIAVDEAHCISQWGYDFRPNYLKISELRENLGFNVPFLALTATATPEVAVDIQEKLNFNAPNLMQKSFERSNLAYKIEFTESKRDRLLQYLHQNNGSSVIYLRSRLRTKEFSDFLNKNGISSSFYHAGLSSDVRGKRQDDWINNETRIICSTNAFGMGIDKPDVRSVIHLDLPDNLEAYFQEAGRAGRDEQSAEAISFLHQSDVISLKERIEASFPPLNVVREVYQGICNKLQLAIGSGLEETFGINLFELAEHVSVKLNVVYSAMKILELNNYIALSQSAFSPSTLRIKMSHEELLNFSENNANHKELLHLILRNYNRITEGDIKVQEAFLSKSLKISRTELEKKLDFLDKLDVLSYKKQSKDPQITFTLARMDIDKLYFEPGTYVNRKKRAHDKMDSVIAFISKDQGCRSIDLLSYFGETKATACGVCDLCLTFSPIALSKDFDLAKNEIKAIVKNEPISLKDLQIKINSTDNPDFLVNVVQWLLDNKQLKLDQLNRLCLE